MAYKKDKPIIEVKNLSKEYLIGADRTYKTLSGSITNTVRHPVQSLRNIGNMGPKESFYALKDINLEVQRGEVLGIIGRNGAGKSTLLKILSRITHPTEGEIVIRGRVGSLLEIGTGFHPELTGRENIYFNGAILGMKKREIDDKFDEIVKFSGVEQFLDTPTKRYSSGMNVRLAFSVAAHLDPEILLVDEVLAVGDAEFQKKCLGKMKEVSKEGRTVLFVSHNMGAITNLCKRGLLIDSGKVLDVGEINAIVNKYIYSNTNSNNHWSTIEDPSKPLQVLEIYIVDVNGNRTNIFDISDTIKIIIKHRCLKELIGAVVAVFIYNNGNELIHTFDSDVFSDRLIKRQPGVYVDEIELPKKFFKAGIVSISIATAYINKSTTIEYNESILSISIEELFEDTSFKGYAAIRSGLLSTTPEWKNNIFLIK